MAFALSALFGLTGVWCAFPAAEAVVTAVGAALYLRGPRPQLYQQLR